MRKNYKHSEETKRKIGLANKGRVPSKECLEKAWSASRGRHHSEDAKKKIGAYWKGRNRTSHTAWNRGKKGIMPPPWNKGRKCPERSGERHHNWKGGITPENVKVRISIETRLWRESVFARDNWTCQKYGTRGCKLNPHHIQNFSQYPELRFAIDNGITLSEKAHREFHKKYGRKNNNLTQMKEFLSL